MSGLFYSPVLQLFSTIFNRILYFTLMNESALRWIGFNLFVLFMLALDLGVFHRKSHAVSVKEALIWTGVWITMALFFNLLIYYQFGEEKAVEFCYILERTGHFF